VEFSDEVKEKLKIEKDNIEKSIKRLKDLTSKKAAERLSKEEIQKLIKQEKVNIEKSKAVLKAFSCKAKQGKDPVITVSRYIEYLRKTDPKLYYVAGVIVSIAIIFINPLMQGLMYLVLAVGPGIGLAVYIYYADKWEPEPKKVLVYCFFLGCFSCIPAAIIEEGFFNATGLEGMIDGSRHFTFSEIMFACFIGIALTEEFSKFLFIKYISKHLSEFNEPMDGIVYGGIIGCGFATLENMMYVAIDGYETGILRMLTAVPSHACDGIILGYFIAKAWISPKRESLRRPDLAGLLLVIVLHGFYDFGLVYGEDWAVYVFTAPTYFFGLYFALKSMRTLKSNSEAIALSSKEYFILVEDEKWGPLRIKDARDMLAKGLLQLDDELIDKESGEKHTIKKLIYTISEDVMHEQVTAKLKKNSIEPEMVSSSPSPKDTTGSYQGTPLPEENRLFCGKCGKDNSKDNSFCTHCGKTLS
jgi:protease PrsW